MLSLKSDTQSDIIEAFKKTSRYLDDILNIDNPFFYTLCPFIYPKELCLNKTNESDFSAPFLGLDLSINNGIISSKIYDIWMEMFLVLHLTGFTFHNLSVLLGPVPLLKISVIERSQNNFLNRVTDLINFGKHFRNSIIEIFLLLASINVS